MRFPHLRLTDWPFQVVPDARFCSFMADRAQVHADLENLLRNMGRREQSSIHLVWAWFGSGKTHMLKYLCHLCGQRLPAIQTSYTEFPRLARSFVDLYRSFAAEMEMDGLKEKLTDLFTTPGLDESVSRLQSSFPDLGKAIRLLVFGNEDHQLIATRWLRGEPVGLRDLRSVGIGDRLKTPESAVRAVSWLAQVFGRLGSFKNSVGRLTWIIDEFQLIQRCRPSAVQEITGCLHALLNRAPTNLTLFISFSGKPEKKFPAWLSKELADRIGIEKVIVLPPLTATEALKFVEDVLCHFRAPGDATTPTFPFEPEAVDEILRIIRENRAELKPRTLMQSFGAVLEEADPLLEHGRMSSIRSDFVRRVLQARLFQDEANAT